MLNKSPQLPPSCLEFLALLKQNNNRDWFNERKDRFLEEQSFVETFADYLLAELNFHDLIETPSGKKSLQRIYRDTRFSKEKIPYKTNWSGGFKRATAQRRGGYYFHLEPDNKSFLAGGFWAPNAEDLRQIRNDINFDDSSIRKILQSDSFTDTFGALKGEQLRTTPKGFDASGSAIDLLRYKQYLLIRNFTDEEVLSSGFIQKANQTFKNMRPFFDYMSEVLSTNADGLSK